MPQPTLDRPVLASKRSPPRWTSRRRPLRWLGRVALGLLGIAAFVVGAVAMLLWATLPPTAQAINIPGLSAPVDVTFDADGVPRIRAANEADAAAALGFVHARDRMLQLELMRRAASGRLSELLGEAGLSVDREMRTLGLRRRALADLSTIPPADLVVLERYAAGVNAWIAQRGRWSSAEFALIGSPARWEPVDSLLWAKTMGLWLAGNWQQELARLSLSASLPPERIAQLWPATSNASPSRASLPGDPGLARHASSVLDALPRFPEPFTLPDTASNGWAVAGSRSVTGAPLLAGDPHLLYLLPGLWYLARIERPDGTWAGATAPGVPGIVMGRNDRIAWTFTTTGADTQDVFVETPEGAGSYRTPDGPRPFSTHVERIGVRGAEDVVLTVRETRHGPVISDLSPRPDGQLLSVAMAALQPGETSASGFLALNRATDLAGVEAAAALITSPVQNLIAADRSRIGLFTTGRIPIRRSGDGRSPAPGADGSHDWLRLASGPELPIVLDPPEGFIANGNEPVAPPGFPVFMGSDGQSAWRGLRIAELLRSRDRHDVGHLASMQTDVQSLFAQALLPRLRAVPATEPMARRALDLLGGWDGRMEAIHPAPLVFNAWLTRFREDVLRAASIPERSPAVSALGFVWFLLGPGSDPDATGAWCGGPCDAALARSLAATLQDLSQRLGPDPAAWRWGDLHASVFAHPILRFVPVLGGLVEARIPTGGDTTTVNRQEALFGGFESVHGGAYRAAYDLAEPDRSRFIAAPGQSGHLLAPSLRAFASRWGAGESRTLGPANPTDPVSATLRLLP